MAGNYPRGRKIHAAATPSKTGAASMVSEPMLLGSTLEDDDVQAWLPMVHNEETLVEPVDSWALLGDVRMVDRPPPPPPWRRREARSAQKMDRRAKSRYPWSFDHVELGLGVSTNHSQLRSREEDSDLDAESSSVWRHYQPPHTRVSASSIPYSSSLESFSRATTTRQRTRYQPPHLRNNASSIPSPPHRSSWKDESDLDVEMDSAQWSRRSTQPVRRNSYEKVEMSRSTPRVRRNSQNGEWMWDCGKSMYVTRGGEIELSKSNALDNINGHVDNINATLDDFTLDDFNSCLTRMEVRLEKMLVELQESPTRTSLPLSSSSHPPSVRRNASSTPLSKNDPEFEVKVPKLHTSEPVQLTGHTKVTSSPFESVPLRNGSMQRNLANALLDPHSFDVVLGWDESDDGQTNLEGDLFNTYVEDELSLNEDVEKDLESDDSIPMFESFELQATADLLSVEHSEVKTPIQNSSMHPVMNVELSGDTCNQEFQGKSCLCHGNCHKRIVIGSKVKECDFSTRGRLENASRPPTVNELSEDKPNILNWKGEEATTEEVNAKTVGNVSAMLVELETKCTLQALANEQLRRLYSSPTTHEKLLVYSKKPDTIGSARIVGIEASPHTDRWKNLLSILNFIRAENSSFWFSKLAHQNVTSEGLLMCWLPMCLISTKGVTLKGFYWWEEFRDGVLEWNEFVELQVAGSALLYQTNLMLLHWKLPLLYGTQQRATLGLLVSSH